MHAICLITGAMMSRWSSKRNTVRMCVIVPSQQLFDEREDAESCQHADRHHERCLPCAQCLGDDMPDGGPEDCAGAEGRQLWKPPLKLGGAPSHQKRDD